MEQYWAVVSYIFKVIDIVIESVVLGYFILPFMCKKTAGRWSTVTYFTVMIFLAVIPVMIDYPVVIALIITFLVMSLIDRKNTLQKAVLIITMYLIIWIAHGISLIPRSVLFSLVINTEYMMSREWLQLGLFALTELIFCGVNGFILYGFAKGIHKVYINKKEDVSGREFLLLFSTLMTVLMGCLSFSVFGNIYEAETGAYIWNQHKEYRILEIAYQVISCVSLFVVIVVYQRIKTKQQEEKENMILAQQLENVKNHIAEVEQLYGDIRGMKHDMGNHIQVLEQLFIKNEKEGLEQYFSELKEKWNESDTEIKSGNPVTDIVLRQRQKEAEEKGIDFTCDFFYPSDTKIEAFDLSVILNNGLDNAFRGVEGCENPYVHIRSYRKKNAYMIEIENCIYRDVSIDTDTGLPVSTKKNRKNHGFGLINIRKIVQKYYGDIDIEQKEQIFRLSILLMVL